MKFVLAFGFEYFDQIHQVFMFQMLNIRVWCACFVSSSIYLQHSNFPHGDAFDGWVIVGLDEFLNRHRLVVFLVSTFEHLS